MEFAGFSAAQWLALLQHELLLFTGIMFLLGAVDEWSMDLAWVWFRLTGRGRAMRLPPDFDPHRPLASTAAVFIPAWEEAGVIGDTLRSMCERWPHEALRIYVGCYPNDAATLEAVMRAASCENRIRLVLNARPGPSTKADCLNRLYAALREDEARGHPAASMVLLHDAEDLVDPAALVLLDQAMQTADFVQLPVLPSPQPRSRWIGSHYVEEFAEAHAKSMVVRDEIGASVPSAGVGCAVARSWLDRLAGQGEDGLPFAADSLTEDYELGLRLGEMGARSRFVRMRHPDGRLIATRAFFPASLASAVRQKTRWVSGIALHGWDRTGWTNRPSEVWMRVRDRKGPFTGLVLALAYVLLVIVALTQIAAWAGWGVPVVLSPALRAVLVVNAIALVWRAAFRFAFTAREFGPGEGLRAVLRIPLANIIAIMAGRRAVLAYWRALRGGRIIWDKTAHHDHPARQPAHRTLVSNEPESRIGLAA